MGHTLLASTAPAIHPAAMGNNGPLFLASPLAAVDDAMLICMCVYISASSFNIMCNCLFFIFYVVFFVLLSNANDPFSLWVWLWLI
jgi:hypothetical protein